MAGQSCIAQQIHFAALCGTHYNRPIQPKHRDMAYFRAIPIPDTLRTFFLVAWLLAGFSTSAIANLQFDVFPGYDSMAREGQWCPVSFEIKNDGPTFSGFIEISSMQMNRSQSRLVPIELPTGTLKRVTIPVFSSSRFICLRYAKNSDWNL